MHYVCNDRRCCADQEQLCAVGSVIQIHQFWVKLYKPPIAFRPHVKTPVRSLTIVPPRVSCDDTRSRMKPFAPMSNREVALLPTEIDVFSSTYFRKLQVKFHTVLDTAGDEMAATPQGITLILWHLRGDIPEVSNASKMYSIGEDCVGDREICRCLQRNQQPVGSNEWLSQPRSECYLEV